MYSSTRMLFDMARKGSAPKAFARLDARGVPMNALYATQAVLEGKWLSVLSTYIGILLFLVIWLSYKWKHKTKLIAYQDMDVKPLHPDHD
ncbi:GABA permease GabP [Mycobacteroides abscessus subsp. abscessus]|nr:GABA permease GabP [Mycobacteroides abscessus subsp. abscessus]